MGKELSTNPDVVYNRIHAWLGRNYSQRPPCKHCGKSNGRLEWALRKGFEYDQDIKNYISLCPSCHRKYDMTDEFRRKMSKIRIGVASKWSWKGVDVFENGIKTTSYESVEMAKKALGISGVSIWKSLKNPDIIVKGYQFKQSNKIA